MALALEDLLTQRIRDSESTPLVAPKAPQLDEISQAISSAQTKTDNASYETSIIEAAKKRNISPAIALSMIGQESSYDPSAVSKKGAVGLGQMIESTARSRGVDFERLKTDPQYQIETSLDYLADLQKYHKGDMNEALQSYYGRGKNQLEGGTNNYVGEVNSRVAKNQEKVDAYESKNGPGLVSRAANSVGNAAYSAVQKVGELTSSIQPLEQESSTGAGEAVLSLGTGMVGGTIGVANFIEQSVRDIGSDKPENYWKNLVEKSKKLGEEFTYAPKTEIGQETAKALSLPFEALHEFSQRASEAPLSRMLFTPDQRAAVAYAHELVTMALAGKIAHEITGTMRSKISAYKSEFTKVEQGTSSPLLLAERAESLIEASKNVPEIQNALDLGGSIDPKLLPNLRTRGQTVLEVLNRNPDNISYQSVAKTYLETTDKINDATVQGFRERINELIPESDNSAQIRQDRIANLRNLQNEQQFTKLDDWLHESEMNKLDHWLALQEAIRFDKEGVNFQEVPQSEISSTPVVETISHAPALKVPDVVDIKNSQPEIPVVETPPKRSRGYRREKFSPVSAEEEANFSQGIENTGPEIITQESTLQEKLNTSSSQPSKLSPNEKLQVVKEMSENFSEKIVAEIHAALEENRKISSDLLNEIPNAEQRAFVSERFQEALKTAREGMDESKPRNIKNVVSDFLTATLGFDIGQAGMFGNVSLSHAQKMAAQRLQADAIKFGHSLSEELKKANISEEQKVLFVSYLDELKNPVPPSGTVPRNMNLDVNSFPGGNNPVVIQDVQKNGKPGVPLFQNEIDAVQNAPTQISTLVPLAETGIYTQEKFGIKKLTSYPLREAKKSTNIEVSQMRKDLTRLQDLVSYSERKNISNYVSQQSTQKNTTQMLPQQTNFSISPMEQKVLSIAEEGVLDIIKRTNEVRDALGKDEIPVNIANPLLFAKAIVAMRENKMGINIASDDLVSIAQKYSIHKFDSLPQTLTQKVLKMSSETDIFRTLDAFFSQSLEQLNTAPMYAKLEELRSSTLTDPSGALDANNNPLRNWKLQKENPALYNYIGKWVRNAKGESNFVTPYDNIMRALTENVAWSIMSFAPKVAMAQASSLVHTVNHVGIGPTLEAINMLMSDVLSNLGSKNKTTYGADSVKNSQVLNLRRETALYNEWTEGAKKGDLGGVIEALKEGRPRDLTRTVASKGMLGIDFADFEAAKITWLAAESYGKKQGLSGKNLYSFADDIVVKTQVSGMRADLSPLQQSATGKMLTQFQTFTIGDYNYILNEVLKVGKNVSTNDVIKNLGRLSGIMTAFNIVYEDVLQQNSPLPTPIRDAYRSAQRGDDPFRVAMNYAIGLTGNYLPVFGGSRYNKGIGGPVLTKLFTDIPQSVHNVPGSVPLAEPITENFGVPGSGTFWKLYRPSDTRSIYGKLFNTQKQPTSGGSLNSGLNSSGHKLGSGLK